ncbi:hypothetical protein RI367_005191 [Sorochytrium milnesiophthora]
MPALLHPRGVTWTVDMSSLAGIFGTLNLVLQTASFILMCRTLYTALTNLWRNQSRFWIASAVGVLCLTPVPLFEICYTLSSFSNQTLWSYPPWVTLIGDILLRVACLLLALCRFYRVSVISPLPKSHTSRLFYSMSALIGLSMLVNLWSDAALRLAEIRLGTSGAAGTSTLPEEQALIASDRVVGFVTFLIFQGAVVATDYAFVRILFAAAGQVTAVSHPVTNGGSAPVNTAGGNMAEIVRQRKLTKTLLLPYLPSVIIALLYIFVQILAFVAPTIPKINFTAIALNRFAPAVEAFVFYNVTVRQTRMIMREAKSYSASKSTGGGGGGGAGGMTSSVRGGHIEPDYKPGQSTQYSFHHKNDIELKQHHF